MSKKTDPPRKLPPTRRADAAEPSEFERFETLTKKLVTVPKSKVDKERDKATGKKPARKS